VKREKKTGEVGLGVVGKPAKEEKVPSRRVRDKSEERVEQVDAPPVV